MTAYRRVDDLRSPTYTEISSRPNARYRVWEAFTFLLFHHAHDDKRLGYRGGTARRAMSIEILLTAA